MAVYTKEINVRTFSDKKAYHVVLKLDKNISDSIIINVIEGLCDVWVRSIKDVREYPQKKARSELNVRNCSVNLSYTLSSLPVTYPKVFFPNVHNKYDSTDIENRLKKILGSDLKITSFRETM